MLGIDVPNVGNGSTMVLLPVWDWNESFIRSRYTHTALILLCPLRSSEVSSLPWQEIEYLLTSNVTGPFQRTAWAEWWMRPSYRQTIGQGSMVAITFRALVQSVTVVIPEV